jgi:hypothetical protein
LPPLTLSDEINKNVAKCLNWCFSWDMASDGDLFFQRRAWGFAKAYKIACACGPEADEAAVVVLGAKNALKSDFRMPALGPLIDAAIESVADHEAGLFSNSPREGTQMLGHRLAVIERNHAEFPTSHGLKTVIEQRTCEAIEDGRKISEDAFRTELLEAAGRWAVDRLHFKPTEIDVKKAQHLDRSGALAREEAVFQKCLPELMPVLKEVAASRTGRPARIRREDSPDINSRAGLEGSLIPTAP